MIPKPEMRLLAETVSEAFTASAEGNRRRGKAILEEGLRRAAAAREQGEEWAAELEEHYRRTLGSYGEEHSAPSFEEDALRAA